MDDQGATPPVGVRKTSNALVWSSVLLRCHHVDKASGICMLAGIYVCATGCLHYHATILSDVSGK